MSNIDTHTLFIENDIVAAEPVQIFREEDFVRMVDEQLGRDARDYLNSIIECKNDAIKSLNETIKDGGYDGGYQDRFDAGLAATEEG